MADQPAVVGFVATLLKLLSQLVPASSTNTEFEKLRIDRKIAFWTAINAAATLFAAVLAFGTAILFYLQLRELRNEQRPWIKFLRVTGEIIDPDKPINFTITMDNIGKSPTTFFGVDAVVIDAANEYVLIDTARVLCQNMRHEHDKLSVLPNSPWTIRSNVLPSHAIDGKVPKGSDFVRMTNPYLSGCALYDFDRTRHQTPFGANLTIGSGKIGTDMRFSAEAD
jgi:hypothetical protein